MIADSAGGQGAVSGDRLREYSRHRGEPDWMADWREHAGEVYQSSPLPIRADHLWRYTDPALLVPEAISLNGAGGTVAGHGLGHGRPAAASEENRDWTDLADSVGKGDLAGAGFFRDGRLVRSELAGGPALSGVLLMDLNTAVSEKPDLVRRLLGTLVGPEFGKFEALNAAAFSGGAFLYIPRGRSLEKPIHLLERFSGSGFAATRLLVLVEEGSELTLIDELAGDPGHQGRLSGVAELELGGGSRLQFATIQTLPTEVKFNLTQRTILKRSSCFTPVLASFGGSLAKVDSGTILEGEDSSSEMSGFVSAVGRQRFDHHTLVHHRGRRTRSNLDFKTVLADRARSVYTGLIRIEETAAFSEAYQENRNLLLSPSCRADSIPELEIMTEEVQCKHGATAGPIDPEQLFYLRSRAIPEEEAVRMIVEGHFEPTLLRLPVQLRDKLRRLLRSRLGVAPESAAPEGAAAPVGSRS